MHHDQLYDDGAAKVPLMHGQMHVSKCASDDVRSRQAGYDDEDDDQDLLTCSILLATCCRHADSQTIFELISCTCS